MSKLSQDSSNGKNTTYLACGKTPTRFIRYERGTPDHSAINDQPSSQVCSVIWERDGNVFSSASEKEAGRATRPSIERRQSLKPVSWCRRYESRLGGSPLTCATFEISARVNSRAIEWPAVKMRWVA